MTEKEFKEKLGKEIRKNIPNVILEEAKSQRNNGPTEAIMVKIKGTPYGFALRYAETYQDIVKAGYDPEASVRQIVKDLKNRIDNIDNSVVKDSERLLTDYAFIKSHIRPVLVNKDKNKDLVLRELCGDIAIAFKIYLNDEMSLRVTKIIEDKWKEMWKDVGDFYASAFENEKQVPEIYVPLDDVVRRAGMPLPDDIDSYAYIISNEKICWGAIKVLTSQTVKDLAAKLGGCYIIPSSINECILIPKTEYNDVTEDMNEFISMVNANEIRPDEVLSDSLYFMDECGLISLAE